MKDERAMIIKETSGDIRRRLKLVSIMDKRVNMNDTDEMIFAAYAMGDADATRRLTGKLPDGVEAETAHHALTGE